MEWQGWLYESRNNKERLGSVAHALLGVSEVLQPRVGSHAAWLQEAIFPIGVQKKGQLLTAVTRVVSQRRSRSWMRLNDPRCGIVLHLVAPLKRADDSMDTWPDTVVASPGAEKEGAVHVHPKCRAKVVS